MQMFKTCTVNNMTNLYASYVLTEGVNNLPKKWHPWSSNMSDEFTKTTSSFLGEVTGCSCIPYHAMIFASERVVVILKVRFPVVLRVRRIPSYPLKNLRI